MAHEQQKDGSFLSYSTPHKRSFKNAKIYHSIFPSALILSCLSSPEETTQSEILKNRLAEFLLSQKSEHWSFNYWARGSKETKIMPFPDDLDDTCCALLALFQYNPNLIDPQVMAKVVTILNFVEEKEGGPYYTWLVPPDTKEEWRDIDLDRKSVV